MQRRRMFRISAGLFLLALTCHLGVQNSAARANSETLRHTTITEQQVGFAFELPRGYSVSHAVAGNGQSIAGWFDVTQKTGGPVLDVESERFRQWDLDQPLSDPGDTLLSYVKETALEYCAGDGPEGSIRADSIVSLRRYRTVRGYQVFEIVVRMVEETYAGDGDDEDSTSIADSIHVVEPDTTYTRFFTAGPIYAVDLSGAGARLVVWVRPPCGEGMDNAAGPVARRITQTLRRVRT